jgi:hypothetical protein
MKKYEAIQGYGIILKATATRGRMLRLVVLLSLLLTGMPTQAINYKFSSLASERVLPSGCLDISTESIPNYYECTVIALAAGDTISLGSSTPVTVQVLGAFGVYAENIINSPGTAADLAFIVTGAVTLGADSIVNANVTGSAAVTLGAGSMIGGNITAIGIVDLGTGSTVSGFIHTGVAVNVGTLSKVGAGIKSVSGVVNIFIGSEVGGDIETGAGAINIFPDSTICGSAISTGAGAVTIATNIKIGGNIETFDGAITVNDGSKVVGDIITSGAGVMTATNTDIGGYILTKIGAITLNYSNVGGTVTSGGAKTITGGTTENAALVVTGPEGCLVSPILDHLQIEHDGQGLTCAAESVTVRACADSACSTLYSDAIEVNLSINGIFDQLITVNGGSTIANLAYTNANTATLSVDQTHTCKNGGSTSCEVEFSDAGFIFLYGAAETTSISNQTSGTNFADIIKLQAVENVAGVCSGLFTGNVDVQLSQQNMTPSVTSGLSFNVNGTSGTAIGKYPTYIPNITLNFGADSKATIPTPVYLDAGQIRLHAKYNVAGVNLVGESTDFWVSPAKLVIAATSSGSGINSNSSSSAIQHKAGQIFDLTVTAYNSLGTAAANVTANYLPNDIQLLLTRTGPIAGGVNGTFTYGTGTILSNLKPSYQSVKLSEFELGVSYTNSASYSEVGLLTLDLQDKNYGDQSIVIPATDINIGRFTPDYFEQTVVEQGGLFAVCNQNTTTFAYTGQVTVSDAAKGAISYLVNPVVELTAKNVHGVTTQNYTEPGYNKLIAAADFIIAPTTDATMTDKNTNLLPLTANLFAGTLSHDGLVLNDPGYGFPLDAGVLHYELADEDNFFYPRNANSEVIAQDTDIDFLIDQDNFVDSDGIGITSMSLENITSTTSINLRFGRASIDNTFGPETDNFSQKFYTQYLNASGRYVDNVQDSCTAYDGGNIILTSGTLDKNLTSVNTVTGQLEEGETQAIILTAPGAGSQGTITVEYDIYPWLKFDWNGVDDPLFDVNPSATATFGLFRGNDRIIYRRELSD